MSIEGRALCPAFGVSGWRGESRHPGARHGPGM